MADIIDDIINRTYQSTILNQDVMDEEVVPEVVGLGAPMSGRGGTTSQQDVEQEQEAPRPTNAVMGYLKQLAQEYGYNAKAPQAGVRVPATTPTLDTTKMYDVYNTPLYDFMRNNEGGVDEDVSMWVRENRDLPSEVLDEYLSSIQDVYDTYGDRKTTRMIDAPEGQGELSNPEPLYKMAEEIDPGTIETGEIGLMARPEVQEEDVSSFDQTVMDFIEENEGRKNTPYKDTKGLWTVGVGHLIGKELPEEYKNADGTPRTLSDEEVQELFDKDYAKHKAEAESLPMYSSLDETGKQALIDLTFNMGLSKFNQNKWPKFFAALEAQDLQKAAAELKDSKWYDDVKTRAPKVINLIKGASFN